ncbi:DUF4328 domain-containing protein [Kitasatospora sp. NPDC059571]|uniref:DUF4328 domain-containing protein n=1 Tax=Kitasatospora sp. NPDC059571 TaxID=3346871 RepID=UPI00368A4B4C
MSAVPAEVRLLVRAAVHRGRFRDPAVFGWMAQALLALQALVQVVLAFTPQTGPQVFAVTQNITTPLFLATSAAFLVWFHRCRVNAEALAPGRHRYAVGTAVAVWFVPVLMWWAPRRAVLDISRAGGSDPAGVRLVNAWWAAWLIKSVGLTVYMVVDLDGDPSAVWMAAVNTAAAALAITVVHRISRSQRALLAAGSTPT